MRTLIVVLAVVMLTSTAQGAARKLPSKFVGHWCGGSNQESTFTRGRCDRNRDDWMVVNANGFEGHETTCRVLSAVALAKDESYQVKFRRSGEGDTWTENSRMSLDNKGRLKMITTTRGPEQ